jgi:hypothetical protein
VFRLLATSTDGVAVTAGFNRGKGGQSLPSANMSNLHTSGHSTGTPCSGLLIGPQTFVLRFLTRLVNGYHGGWLSPVPCRRSACPGRDHVIPTGQGIGASGIPVITTSL